MMEKAGVGMTLSVLWYVDVYRADFWSELSILGRLLLIEVRDERKWS